MPRFPWLGAEVVALADAMIAGYIANPAVFTHADTPGLQAVRATYQIKKNAQTDALAQAQLATEKKDGALESLRDKMQVERREQPKAGGACGAWTQAGVALDRELTLTDQPRGVQLEYRIIAINAGGPSVPSDTAAVVLQECGSILQGRRGALMESQS